jgi:hypothetical protein
MSTSSPRKPLLAVQLWLRAPMLRKQEAAWTTKSMPWPRSRDRPGPQQASWPRVPDQKAATGRDQQRCLIRMLLKWIWMTCDAHSCTFTCLDTDFDFICYSFAQEALHGVWWRISIGGHSQKGKNISIKEHSILSPNIFLCLHFDMIVFNFGFYELKC